MTTIPTTPGWAALNPALAGHFATTPPGAAAAGFSPVTPAAPGDDPLADTPANLCDILWDIATEIRAAANWDGQPPGLHDIADRVGDIARRVFQLSPPPDDGGDDDDDDDGDFEAHAKSLGFTPEEYDALSIAGFYPGDVSDNIAATGWPGDEAAAVLLRFRDPDGEPAADEPVRVCECGLADCVMLDDDGEFYSSHPGAKVITL